MLTGDGSEEVELAKSLEKWGAGQALLIVIRVHGQAAGLMTLEELGSKFGELDRTRGLARAELERLQRRRERVVESYAGMILPDALDALSGEERRLYGMLRLEVAPTPEGLDIAGALSSTSGIEMVTSSPVMSRLAVRVRSSALLFRAHLQVKR